MGGSLADVVDADLGGAPGAPHPRLWGPLALFAACPPTLATTPIPAVVPAAAPAARVATLRTRGPRGRTEAPPTRAAGVPMETCARGVAAAPPPAGGRAPAGQARGAGAGCRHPRALSPQPNGCSPGCTRPPNPPGADHAPRPVGPVALADAGEQSKQTYKRN
eukprot:TRINITY_DN12985_c0_g1_i1.p5 TRINITY_DN12985_c0_g1~~TRINITY_DN12985_c0_g1_i1.p5  ORF type:complete len:163 (-),score=7.69 TRINITY_DN12985_c0_g1_i1:39-527(-)